MCFVTSLSRRTVEERLNFTDRLIEGSTKVSSLEGEENNIGLLYYTEIRNAPAPVPAHISTPTFTHM